MTKYIVVCGGVMSGVGKGVATASIGKILQSYGFSTTAVKIDPYINCDAGTLRPTEHGEVWVTLDGGEIDQDLGNYERFLGFPISKRNNITTGQVFRTLIEKERRGDFLGQTVQLIPHLTDEIKLRIKEVSDGFDFVLVEIGGTVGDYENVPFMFAIKSLEREVGRENIVYVLITYLPIPDNVGEMKTKPTQTAIRLMVEQGLVPDFILCRAKVSLDDVRKKKIETYANISSDNIISAPDVSSIYEVPLNFEKQELGLKLLKRFGIKQKKKPNWDVWADSVSKILHPSKIVSVALVGKYVTVGDFTLKDSYISIHESLVHAGAANDCAISVAFIDASEGVDLSGFDGIIVPGGFGSSGVDGKISAIKFARENKVPYLGLCYGMQLAVVEYSRNVCGLSAHTTEVEPSVKDKVIDILPEQGVVKEKGASMRLGAYAANILQNSLAHSLYARRLKEDSELITKLPIERTGIISKNVVVEVHRHRYELNPAYLSLLEERGLVISGWHERTDGTKLAEFVEIPSHPFFIATQAHPEFRSSLLHPAPLFSGFIKACLLKKQLVVPAEPVK
ncbi:CTP synthase (glutamine hydrolyzing) [Candidatus Woesearchaeota archaeon]|nr:CTP synthase (glutamine hydrolyzing) [Candidatus Woesearchaeota archaeon]